MDKTIIFVQDMFAEDFIGGAELTTDAIIKSAPSNIDVVKIRSTDVSKKTIDQYKTHEWIFGNFFNLNPDLILYFMAQMPVYSIIEYDYKYCMMRIPKLHKKRYGSCCEKTTRAQIISLFFSLAKYIWWMSEGQKQWIENTFPVLQKKKNSFVLSSILGDEILNKINNFDCSQKNNTYLIQQHNHPLKGTQKAIELAKQKGLSYELFSNLSHDKMLKKFAESKGLIFTPTEFDTCARVTIEAKLLGCDLILNDNVQHKDEVWFSSRETIISYLKKQLTEFWSRYE